MKLEFDGLTYRDPSSKKARRVPLLKRLEQRMYNSLMRAEGNYVKKIWLASRLKTGAKLLYGTKKVHPMSGDITIEMHYDTVVLDEVFDPLAE